MPTIEKSEWFDQWLRQLRDHQGKAKILVRVRGLVAGNPGDALDTSDASFIKEALATVARARSRFHDADLQRLSDILDHQDRPDFETIRQALDTRREACG